MEQESGFFESLFDFSFSRFITTKIIKLLYGVAIFFCGLGALFMLIGGFTQGFGAGILSLILSPLVFLLSVILCRVYLEILVVLFRIADYTREIAQSKKGPPVT